VSIFSSGKIDSPLIRFGSIFNIESAGSSGYLHNIASGIDAGNLAWKALPVSFRWRKLMK